MLKPDVIENTFETLIHSIYGNTLPAETKEGLKLLFFAGASFMWDATMNSIETSDGYRHDMMVLQKALQTFAEQAQAKNKAEIEDRKLQSIIHSRDPSAPLH